MAPSKTRSLADQLADLEDPTPKDFDPEDLENDGPSSDEDGAGQPSDVNAGREHYEAVGKGKLRKQDPVRLGKQYAGERVSRDALEADSDDDPFAAHTDDEDDSDAGSDGSLGLDDDDSDASEQSESGAKQQKTLPKTQRKNSMDSQSDSDFADSDSNVDEDSEEEDDSEDDDDDVFDEEVEDGMEDESEDDEVAVAKKKRNTKVHSGSGAASDDREELRRLMASDQKTIAATISQAAKADAAKGKAVKEQRTTFDALLNTRIKLQKGLGAINEMSALVAGEKDAGSDEHGEADEEAIKSAESAALALWSTLEELRNALADAHSKDGSKKRKRPSPIIPTTKSALLWERMADLESESLAHRRSTLDKWSSKVRGTSTSLPNARGKLLGSGSKQSITAVLDAHVATEIGDRSSKRARQSNGSSTEAPEPVYDDTVFYQSLLRELVEQRMSSDAMTGGLDTQLPSRLPIHPITGMRNDKVKRENVDTRASKGRKMRFNVHEKLQNFMAPEDRGSWTVRARDEFFASLLGKTASGLLGEGDESGSDMESDEDREEGGLKLFRN
ncbi:Protein bfr2 [Penicillium odoratum]|uniref:Protein bfr2 n=1 Tax=Penicillium odoratum TaxID=1167516 RepID=UPI00254841A4|nr:Protein bfr2 [Penicillium odoratum]KAJ5758521.1 Protein bfr2 [Penicillium odoratum]